MYRNKITLTPAAPNLPLKPCWVGTGSGALFLVEGVPDAMASVKLYLYGVDAPSPFFFVGTKSADGEFEVYAGGANFPVAGQTSYEIEIKDTEDRVFWCGRGLLTIITASGGGTEGGGSPMIKYIFKPSTGLWYEIIITENELGENTLTTSAEGVAQP